MIKFVERTQAKNNLRARKNGSIISGNRLYLIEESVNFAIKMFRSKDINGGTESVVTTAK